MMKVEDIIGQIETLEVEVTIEIIGIEVNIVDVKGRTLRIETGHMIESEVGMEMTVEDLGGEEERMNLEIEIGLNLGIKVRREGFITAECKDIL